MISSKSVEIEDIEAAKELETLLNCASVAKVASKEELKFSKVVTLVSLDAV